MAENLTLTRALKELKNIDARIQTKTAGLVLFDFKQNKYKGKALHTTKTVEQFEKDVKADYQSLMDLVSYRNKLKSRLVIANATKSVKVAGKSMTIAEAIDAKGFLATKKVILNKMRSDYTNHVNHSIKARTELDKQLETMINANLGKDRKADSEDYKKVAEPFIDANELTLIDPIKADEKIKELEKEINDFEAEVDISLSEANATTTIEV